MKKGAFCISIDLELAWGVWDNVTREYLAKCLELERAIVNRILRIFERYEIPATWAIVGHLLEKREGCPVSELPAWFAPDIIDAIRRAKTTQEIGSHSFAHIYFSETTAEAAASDLLAARMIHQRDGLDFSAFVFPRKMVDHLELLTRAGIRVFRGVDHGWHSAGSGRHPVARLAHLIETMIPSTPAVVRPVVHPGGMVELPGSMVLMGRDGLRKLVRRDVLELKARRGLRAAARKKAVFHLWFHPSNFYYETESQFATLEAIVKEAAVLRAQQRLDILPMGSFAGAGTSEHQHP